MVIGVKFGHAGDPGDFEPECLAAVAESPGQCRQGPHTNAA